MQVLTTFEIPWQVTVLIKRQENLISQLLFVEFYIRSSRVKMVINCRHFVL